MATLNTNAANLFEAQFRVLLQQSASKFKPLVEVKEIVGAEFGYVNQIDATTFPEVADLTVDTVFTNTTTARRQIPKKIFARHELVTMDQINDMNFDPKGGLIANIVRAANRAMDDCVIAAADGTAQTGKDGATPTALPAGQIIAAGGAGASYQKLLDATEIFLENDYEGGELHYALSPKNLTDLSLEDKFINNDFERLQVGGISAPMMSGYNGSMRINGLVVNFFVSNRLGVDGSGDRKSLLWAPDGICLGVGVNPTIEVTKNPMKNNQPQISAEAYFGATRLDEDKVVVITNEES